MYRPDVRWREGADPSVHSPRAGGRIDQEGSHFLLLDDVLTATDNDRLPRICDLLTEMAGKMQVILFTCHPERFAMISKANLIDVEALQAPAAATSRA